MLERVRAWFHVFQRASRSARALLRFCSVSAGASSSARSTGTSPAAVMTKVSTEQAAPATSQPRGVGSSRPMIMIALAMAVSGAAQKTLRNQTFGIVLVSYRRDACDVRGRGTSPQGRSRDPGEQAGRDQALPAARCRAAGKAVRRRYDEHDPAWGRQSELPAELDLRRHARGVLPRRSDQARPAGRVHEGPDE